MSGGMMGKGYEGGDTKDDDYGVSYLSIDICSIAKTQRVYKFLTLFIEHGLARIVLFESRLDLVRPSFLMRCLQRRGKLV
jgi:hypothetical protein